jgi:VanZ family protein
LSDEFHQMFVPGRVADVRDVLTDGTGALLALAILGSRGCHKQRG